MTTQHTDVTGAQPTSVGLAELRDRIAQEISAGSGAVLTPTTFRAHVDGSTIVEIAAARVSGTKATGWTACLDPEGANPKWVKRNLFWSWSADDAAQFCSPEEALASARHTS